MEQLKEASAAQEAEARQYIVIRLGAEQYGIDISHIDNIVRMQHITRIPKGGAYLKGVINLRGEVIPVMSLRLKMGLTDDEITKSSRIIIVRIETIGSIGLLVDEVREVVRLDTSVIEKVAYDTKDEKNGYLSGVGKYDRELISLLDLQAITQEAS